MLCILNGTVSPLEFAHKVQMLKLRGLCTCMRVYYTGKCYEPVTIFYDNLRVKSH